MRPQVLELEGLADDFIEDGLLLKLYDNAASLEGDYIGEVAVSLEGLLQVLVVLTVTMFIRVAAAVIVTTRLE